MRNRKKIVRLEVGGEEDSGSRRYKKDGVW